MKVEEERFAYFNQLPLKTESFIESFMKDLGVTYYDKKVVVTIDALNVDVSKLNKMHVLYDKIIEAKKNKETHFTFNI